MGNEPLTEERRRILEMVEKGRITARQADELLNALREPPETPPPRPAERPSPCRRGDMGWVGRTVADVVERALGSLFGGPEDEGRRRPGGG